MAKLWLQQNYGMSRKGLFQDEKHFFSKSFLGFYLWTRQRDSQWPHRLPQEDGLRWYMIFGHIVPPILPRPLQCNFGATPLQHNSFFPLIRKVRSSCF